MKRILALLLALVMLLALTACGVGDEGAPAGESAPSTNGSSSSTPTSSAPATSTPASSAPASSAPATSTPDGTSSSQPSHTHSYSSKIATAATCDKEGVKTFTCSCGDTFTEKISATGHSWGNWETTKEPALTTKGQAQRKCSVCSETESKELDKLPSQDTSTGDNVPDEDDPLQSPHIALASEEDIYALSRILSTNYAKGKYYSNPTVLSLEDDLNRFEIPSEFTTNDDKIKYLQTASYKLVNDVNVMLTKEYGATAWDTNAFMGIGSSAYPFKGSFNGNNKTISLSCNADLATRNLTVNYIGFFSETTDANILNTNVVILSDITATESFTADSRFAMGGLVGFASQSNISNCSITFKNVRFGLNCSAELFDDRAYVGGLVGQSNLSVFDNCKVYLKNSEIYVKANKVSGESAFGGVSVGGLLGWAWPGSDNTTELGKLGVQLYNCSVTSNNTTQQDVIVANIEGGTECAVGGVVGMAFNNLLAINCTATITKGNIVARQSESTASSYLGTAVGGIIGRMEHTGQLIDCKVTGNNLNIGATGPDNRHLVGGIAGNAYGPVHRNITPILHCHFEGSGNSTIYANVDTTNLKADSHPVGVGGIAGLAVYQIYDCTVKNVLIINHSEGMKTYSFAGEIVGVWQATVSPGDNFVPGPIEIGRCTYSGVKFDISSNVVKTSID